MGVHGGLKFNTRGASYESREAGSARIWGGLAPPPRTPPMRAPRAAPPSEPPGRPSKGGPNPGISKNAKML